MIRARHLEDNVGLSATLKRLRNPLIEAESLECFVCLLAADGAKDGQMDLVGLEGARLDDLLQDHFVALAEAGQDAKVVEFLSKLAIGS